MIRLGLALYRIRKQVAQGYQPGNSRRVVADSTWESVYHEVTHAMFGHVFPSLAKQPTRNRLAHAEWQDLCWYGIRPVSHKASQEE